MIAQSNSKKKMRLLHEITEKAVELSLENQELLLMMAKAMQHTRNCIIKQNEIKQSSKIQISLNNLYHKT